MVKDVLWRGLPIVAGLTVAGMVLALWWALLEQEQRHIELVMGGETAAVVADLTQGIESRVQALIRMAARWEQQGRPTRQQWEADAELYLAHYPGYQAMAWLDSAGRMNWTVPRGALDPAGNPADRPSPPDGLRARGSVRLTPSIPLPDGEQGFLAYVPIHPPQGFDGYLVAVFRARELLPRLIHEDVKHVGYAIGIDDGSRVLYQSASFPAADASWTRTTELPLYGVTWRLRLAPTVGHLDELRSLLPVFTLGFGMVLAVLLALVTHYARVARQQERRMESVNRALAREVEERRAAEQAVARHAQELAHSNAELEQFAYVASHDLQEPLRIVSGYVQLLERRYRGRLDADADEFIHFTVDAAVRMQALINDLLAYSRLRTRQKPHEPVDCNAVLEQTKRALQAAIAESGAVITADLLPTVTGDATQLGQLFLNLLSNAIKYRSDAAPAIHVGVTDQGGKWRFSVRDNGIGIDPRYSDRIFVIFQRLHGKGEYSGTGIGLAICRKVVENHGGRIWLESQLGHGATFYFTLPKPTR